MKIFWQVEEGGVGYRQSYTRREPKNNILRLLKGREWNGCKFDAKKVLYSDGKEVRVIAGPNYNIPIKISEEHVLIVNIYAKDAVAKSEKSKTILREIAEVDIDTNDKTVEAIIREMIRNIEPDCSPDEMYKVIDLVYMPGKIFEEVYSVKTRSGKMNLSTLLNRIYAIKENVTNNDELDELINNYGDNIKTLF